MSPVARVRLWSASSFCSTPRSRTHSRALQRGTHEVFAVMAGAVSSAFDWDWSGSSSPSGQWRARRFGSVRHSRSCPTRSSPTWSACMGRNRGRVKRPRSRRTHAHMFGCLSKIINNVVGELLRMGHQFISTCVGAQTITAIM